MGDQLIYRVHFHAKWGPAKKRVLADSPEQAEAIWRNEYPKSKLISVTLMYEVYDYHFEVWKDCDNTHLEVLGKTCAEFGTTHFHQPLKLKVGQKTW